VLLVFGGSQGSAALNRVVLEACGAVASGAAPGREALHLLWSTGPKHHEGIAKRLMDLGVGAWVTAVPYLDEMPVALGAADVAVARAGAMSTAELLLNGIPAILVPLPTAAADHQTHNARALAGAGAARVLPEDGLTGAKLWNELGALLDDPSALRSMSERARARAVPDAAAVVARDIAAFLPGVAA